MVQTSFPLERALMAWSSHNTYSPGERRYQADLTAEEDVARELDRTGNIGTEFDYGSLDLIPTATREILVPTGFAQHSLYLFDKRGGRVNASDDQHIDDAVTGTYDYTETVRIYHGEPHTNWEAYEQWTLAQREKNARLELSITNHDQREYLTDEDILLMSRRDRFFELDKKTTLYKLANALITQARTYGPKREAKPDTHPLDTDQIRIHVTGIIETIAPVEKQLPRDEDSYRRILDFFEQIITDRV